MKTKLFTLFFALMASINLWAIGRNDGSTIANAIDYDWDNGVQQSSGTKWYHLDLAPLYYGADSLRFYITNPSNTEAVNVVCKTSILLQDVGVTFMDSIIQTLAPQTTYDGWMLRRELFVTEQIIEIFFTVSTTGAVKLSWQALYPSGDSCEDPLHGGCQEAGTKWHILESPDMEEREYVDSLVIHFENTDANYNYNDISNTISLSFRADCESPEFYSQTFTIEPYDENTIAFSAEMLAALGWPNMVLSCTSSSPCCVFYGYHTTVPPTPGESCDNTLDITWEPVEQQANMDRWYLFHPHDGTFNPIIPEENDLRFVITNTSDETANVNADVYFDCREEERISQKSYVLEPYGSEYLDIDRDFLERFGWPSMIYNVISNQNISIRAELIPDAGRDFVQDTIVAYVCEGDEYIDTIGGGWNFKIISPVEHSMTWIDTFPFRNGLQMMDSIITFYIHPLIMPEPLSAEEMRGIGAAPLLVQGMQLYVDESNAALTEYYRNLGNSVDTITHIDTVYWAKPVYYADGNLNVKKEAPLDLSKYYSKNDYTDTLLLVVRSEECSFIMRIEYIFPIEGYKYVFRKDTICPPDPYYNPDTLTSIVLDTLGLPRWVDTITIYYSMLQPALYSQDEISLLPFVANGQPIDTTFTLSALKQQFADDATNLTARVTNIKWQVLEGDVWMDMPYVVSQTATEIHMRYIVETECAIRDTSMNIILPLTPEPCLIASGTCGTNLTWTLTCDSVLTISGTGAMWDYLNPSDEPWYSYRSSITSLVIEDNVTSISWNFRGLTGLTSVVIGNSITNIGSGAFEGCTGLSSLTIGNHVTSIGTAAFYQCLGLTSIEIPNSVTSIGNHAFWNCFYVTSPIYIHNNVTNIGADAFGACSIPSFEVNSDNSNYCAVDGVLFDKTKHTLIQYPGGNPRTEYTIPETVTSIEYRAFEGAELLTSITIGNNVTSIGNEAFSFCMGLTSIEIPNSVTSIERFTFSYCSNLTSVVLPNSIVDINDGAFAYCRNLTSFTNYATTPQTLKDEYVFSDVNLSNCTLYVPAQSIAAYQTADVWKEFGNILPIEEPIVEPTDSVYEVVYLDQAGLQLDAEPIILHLPVAPVIEGFSFLKWQVVAGDLENGIYIQAVYTANEPTNAPEVYTNPANKAQKLIRNGKVYILTDDKVYSIYGQKVK